MLWNKNTSNNKLINEDKTRFINKINKGFSLIEIVVSLGLIALLIIPAGNMVMGTVKMNKAVEDKQQAIAVLQEAVELIKMEEQKLPQTKNEYIDINSQFRVTRITEDNVLGEFKVESLNESDYGFNVIGTISEVKKIITDASINIDKDVDGAIYFSGDDEGEITVVDRQMSTIDCIEDIVSSGNILFNKVKGNKIDIKSNNGDNMQISIGNSNNEKIHKYDTNSILVVLDNNSSLTKLNLDITNKHHEKDLIIYIYNKNKSATQDDIEKIINTGGGSKNKVIIKLLHSGIEGDKVSMRSLYSIQLKATKNNKVYESIDLDFIK